MTLAGLGLAAAVFLASCWLTGRLCMTGGPLTLLDHPTHRSLHTVPTPRTGGLAILGSLAAGVCFGTVLEWFEIGVMPAGRSVPVPIGAWLAGMVCLLAVVSFADDKTGLPVWIRLCAQLVASAGVVFGAGIELARLDVPGLGGVPLGGLAAPITMLLLIWMSNLYNFMDGMDGFAGGMTVLGFAFLAVTAWRGGDAFILLSALLISMAAAGFLFYNMPPARIFMGDTGSVPLGFAGGALMVLGVQGGTFDIWSPLLIFSPFLMDATATLLRRIWRGEKVWQAHREHYYQRVVLAGWGHRKTVMVEYALMFGAGLSAVAYGSLDEGWRLCLLGFWLLVFAGLAQTVRGVERQAALKQEVV